jgi:glucose/arabinose dehydrogenase
MPLAGGVPGGPPKDFLTGVLNADGRAHGPPASAAIHKTGALPMADAIGGMVWRVTPSR